MACLPFLWKSLSQHHDPFSLTLQVLLLPYSLPGCIIDLFAFCVTDELKASYNLGFWNIFSSLSHKLPLFWKSCKGLGYLDKVNISLSTFSSSCVWYYLQPTLEKKQLCILTSHLLLHYTWLWFRLIENVHSNQISGHACAYWIIYFLVSN